MSHNLQNFAKLKKNQLDHLVDFEKCCKTHIYLQKSVPIQPKTSNILPKFLHFAEILAARAPPGNSRRSLHPRSPILFRVSLRRSIFAPPPFPPSPSSPPLLHLSSARCERRSTGFQIETRIFGRFFSNVFADDVCEASISNESPFAEEKDYINGKSNLSTFQQKKSRY